MDGRSSPGGGVRELHIETPRTALVCLLGGGGIGPVEAWYVLHGYRQLAERFVARFEGIATDQRLIVAPEALSRFYVADSRSVHSPTDAVGASWMTRHGRQEEIRDYVEYLDRVSRVAEEMETSGRTLLGFSQGAHTAARWSIAGRTRFDRVILWGAGLPRDLPEGWEGFPGDPEVLLVRGRDDPLRRIEEEPGDEARLRSAGVRFRVLEHPGGHEIAGDVLKSLAAVRS